MLQTEIKPGTTEINFPKNLKQLGVKMKIIKAVFILIAFSISINAQSKLSKSLTTYLQAKPEQSKLLVWVYFTDKGSNLEKYFANPVSVVSERSLKRRKKVLPESALIDFIDIPLNSDYINKLERFGIKIKQKSKWLNGVSCYIDKLLLSKITKLDFVKEIDLVRTYKRKEKDYNIPVQKQQNIDNIQNTTAIYNYGQSLTQLQIMNVPEVHDQGYTGHGILICLMDAGFDRLSTHEVFQSMNVIATWDFVNNDVDVENGSDAGNGSHGTGTLSLIGGFKEGELIGTSFGASYLLAKTENTESETTVEEDNWIAASEWADSIGADLFSTSLGYLGFDDGTGYDWTDMDGNTAKITVAADLAVKKGIVVFNSAGNEGYNSTHNTLMAPADGDSVFAIGAVDANKVRASFSSVGNTVDGRTKPDFMAMGSGTYAAGNSSDTYYRSFSGTSAACPLAAGVGALMLEKNYYITPMQIRDILRATSDHSSNPDRLYGWGVINALDAMNQIPMLQLTAKIFLEGPYDQTNHNMKMDINSLVPTTSPYSENPRRIVSVPANIVDWVLVQLKEHPDSTAKVSRSVFLRNDGYLVTDDGLSNTIELGAPEGNYYIVIKHRNHLAVMSNTPVTLNTSTAVTYDFTTSESKYYGTGSAVQLESGVWGMWGGDADGSGVIDAADRNSTWNDRNNSGYLNSDVDLSGVVDAADRNKTWNNRNKSSSVQ